MTQKTSKHLDALILNEVEENKKQLLIELDNYDFSHVAIKTAQEWPDLDLEELQTEGLEQLKRYYAMRLIHGNEIKIGIPIKLDPLAHVHVLFTKEYREFCDKFFGGFFDHWPCDRNQKEHMEWLGRVYKNSINEMDLTFNDRNKTWWPDLEGNNYDELCCGCSCAGQGPIKG